MVMLYYVSTYANGNGSGTVKRNNDKYNDGDGNSDKMDNNNNS